MSNTIRVILDAYDSKADANCFLDFANVGWATPEGNLEIISTNGDYIAEFASGKWIAIYQVDAVESPKAPVFSIVPQPPTS